ncbi:hypothetical protein [Photobacterium galatheae]|uniref:Uncharacterized protein n=1 Tax=Photobacterium galatheae TaxID=1654360 RepID=A0A066S0L9_9GAMM|nr:hypothetical protein [Photobacterium galatheae]KDM93502.1 hypothetical protein EA58_01180 [Photobacterium galatheae]MCM0147085.1 hypothetical protein [Photobacterium galatheae]
MSQRDIIIFFSNQLNASYVTTNKGYMNKSKSQLVAMFKKKKSSESASNNANFDKRPGLISVTDIGLAPDFDFDVRKNAGLAKSKGLNVEKESVLKEYAAKGYISTNGVR